MKKLSLSLSLACLFCSLSSAQVITGQLIGSVRDRSGAVLPGATVVLSSPALMGESVVRATNEKGQFRFIGLPPGPYRLEVSLEAFAEYREDNIRIEVGGTVERIVALEIAGVLETVVVSGESPIVDTRKSGQSTNFGNDVLENTPVRRNSVFDMMKSAPGMAATRPSSPNPGVSAFGSGTNENLYLIDGTNFSSTYAGGAVPWPDTDVVQEIEILSTGASAEYGNMQGAVFNVVTKQGGNDFQFDASYYFQAQALTSQPVTLECDCPEGESGYTRARYRDFGTHLGGPILKNRLWFFGGYQYKRDYDGQPGTDPRFPRIYEADRIFWKVTWQITPNLKLLHSYHDDYWKVGSRPTVARPPETTMTSSGHNPTSTFGQLTHIISEDTFWEARVSGFRGPGQSVPSVPEITEPFRWDLATGTASGGAPIILYYRGGLTSVQGKLSHYTSDFLNAGHDFKFGVQFNHGKETGLYGYRTGVSYFDYDGEPYLAYLREPYNYGGAVQNVGFYVEDTATVGDSLTINLGLRFDRNDSVSPDVAALDVNGNETGQTIEGLGTLYFWNVLSPRLGFNLRLTGDGKTVLRGSFGRFHQGTLSSEPLVVHPGVTPVVEAFYDPATGGYTDIVSVTDPAADLRIDSETRAPRTDQYTLGFDRQLGNELALHVTYVHKEGRRFIGWEDIGGVYGVDEAILPDGRTLGVFPLLNDTSERLYFLTNPDGYFLKYNGILLALEKRWSGRWQAGASYSLSKSVGLQASSAGFAASSQNSSTLGYRTFGRDPNDLTNATGNLPNDRTHMLRFQGSVVIPRVDVRLAANFQHLTGKPYAAHTNVFLPQGRRRIFVEPRGARRLESQTLLDLRVSKVWRFARAGRFELVLDIFNLFNDTAAENLNINFYSVNFQEPRAFVDPRRAMIGVKFWY